MRNKAFYSLLHAVKDETGKRPRWTLDKVAQEIYINRDHLNEVINNKHGGQTRPKVIKFLKLHFPNWQDFLEALGWDGEGNLTSNVSHRTLDVQQTEAPHG